MTRNQYNRLRPGDKLIANNRHTLFKPGTIVTIKSVVQQSAEICNVYIFFSEDTWLSISELKSAAYYRYRHAWLNNPEGYAIGGPLDTFDLHPESIYIPNRLELVDDS